MVFGYLRCVVLFFIPSLSLLTLMANRRRNPKLTPNNSRSTSVASRSAASSVASSPARPANSPSASNLGKRVRDIGNADEDDGSDSDAPVTPVRAKRLKQGTTLDKAVYFKAGFPDEATDEEILGKCPFDLKILV